MDISLRYCVLGTASNHMVELIAMMLPDETAQQIMAQLEWYREQTDALARMMTEGNTGAIMACVKAFELDGGKRAKSAQDALFGRMHILQQAKWSKR